MRISTQRIIQKQGGLKLMYETWRSDLLRSLAYMEALIDFGEDEQLDTAILDTGFPLFFFLFFVEEEKRRT